MWHLLFLYVDLNFEKLSNIIKMPGFRDMVKNEVKGGLLPNDALRNIHHLSGILSST